jgi:hypothetical protein
MHNLHGMESTDNNEYIAAYLCICGYRACSQEAEMRVFVAVKFSHNKADNQAFILL